MTHSQHSSPEHDADADADADATSNRILMALRAALRAAGSSTVSIFIDPTLADPLMVNELVRDALITGQALRICLPRIHDDIDPDTTPYLLHVQHELSAERVVSASVARAALEAHQRSADQLLGRCVCAWIIGESNPHELAGRLASAARIIRPDGGFWYLRFWDPRVIWHLPRVLSAADWGDLQSQLGSWWTLNPLLQFATVCSPGTPPDVALSSAQSPGHAAQLRRLSIDEHTWEQLSLVGQINQVLALAWDWGVLPTAGNAKRIQLMLQRCQALGFESEQDSLVFAATALTSHDAFDQHPQVTAALENARAADLPVSAAMAEFDESFWAELATGRWLTKHRQSAA